MLAQVLAELREMKAMLPPPPRARAAPGGQQRSAEAAARGLDAARGNAPGGIRATGLYIQCMFPRGAICAVWVPCFWLD